jgi:hypothetical protein
MLYLDCSCLNLDLGIFLKFLEFFRVFFVALSIYLDNSGFIFAQEKYFGKKHFLSTWAEPVGSTRTCPARPRQPKPGTAGPIRHPATGQRPTAAWPWPPPWPRARPYKGRRPPACRPSCALDPPPPCS